MTQPLAQNNLVQLPTHAGVGDPKVSLVEQSIALLTDLAARGEINPWDVQVIEVIDRFLSGFTNHTHEMDAVEFTANRLAYEAHLSQSGQAFLYASMLVLLKADSLARADAEAEGEADVLDVEDFAAVPMPLHLERQLRRRAVAQPPQQRRVTLQELIDQLKLMATTIAADHTPRPRARRPRPQSRSQATRAIAQLAHQENLTEVAQELEQFLLNQWAEVAQGQDWVELDRLLEQWTQSPGYARSLPAPIHDLTPTQQQVSDRVGAFWALLFLSSQSKVELHQAEFYQELQVRPLVAENPGSSDAPAI